MIVRPWQLGDTDKLKLQPAQEYMSGWNILSADLTDLSEAGLAWTAEHDGVILGIAGLAPQWENRASAWALISDAAGPHFRKFHGAVSRFLVMSNYRRIEATVDVGFEAGHRWMKMLGFEHEGLLRAYRPDGADMHLYARVVR
jgi:RimJ/RimL family protein N-acetyltransferase